MVVARRPVRAGKAASQLDCVVRDSAATVPLALTAIRGSFDEEVADHWHQMGLQERPFPGNLDGIVRMMIDHDLELARQEHTLVGAGHPRMRA